jgi:hypothetical protein
MWFCLHKRKDNKAQKNQGNIRNDQGGYYQQYPPGQDPKETSSQTVTINSRPWQNQTGNYGQYIAEAPAITIPTQPAELW